MATIRPTRPADVPTLVDLFVTVAQEGRWIGREWPFDLAERAELLAGGIADPEQLSLVAVEDDRVVGQLVLHHDGRGRADLGMLLAPHARGRGLGGQLLTEGIRWASEHPVVHKLTLETWPHNSAALALYRRCGFQVEGYLHRHWRRRNGELWDSVVMGLLLPPT